MDMLPLVSSTSVATEPVAETSGGCGCGGCGCGGGGAAEVTERAEVLPADPDVRAGGACC